VRALRPEVKVCGLTRRGDAEAAAAAGAAYLGVVLAPGGRRSVTADAAGVMLDGLAATRVGVFVDAAEDELLRAGEAAGLRVLQLHGGEPPELAFRLREAGWRVWKAVRVRGADDFSLAARRYAGAVDALLLDGWSPAAHGGTGTRFPWAEVAERRGELPAGTGMVAAGGLTPENVAEAARLLRPDVVDVSSGVERAPGVKDAAALLAFAAAVRAPAGAV
jgi:phosphoribosylanthranilate isomerase